MKFDLKRMSLTCAVVVPICTLTTLARAAETVTKVQDFSAWSLFADAKTPHEFCFVTSEPKSTEPAAASRNQARIYVSAWPQDGVKGEVSVRVGFPVKKSADNSLDIGDTPFEVIAVADRIYVKDATQELKVIAAMKKGANLKTTVTSEKGTTVSDTYSLSGLGQALTKLQSECF